MSTFNIIENTMNKSSFSGKDILLAGGLLGSFVYLSMSIPEKVVVVRPKEKHHSNNKGFLNNHFNESLKTISYRLFV